MKAAIIKVKVLRIDANNTVVMVPVVKHDVVLRNKETGKKLTSAQAKKLEGLSRDKRNALVNEEKVLVENNKFWKQNPSANIRIVPDQDHDFKVGDEIEITLKKL